MTPDELSYPGLANWEWCSSIIIKCGLLANLLCYICDKIVMHGISSCCQVGNPSHEQACNQTEQTEQTLRSGSARWLACSVRLARWPILAARARFGLAKQPNWLLALGSAESN